MGDKFNCPNCGCPTEHINKNCIDTQKRWFSCPRCKVILEGIGRVWRIVALDETPMRHKQSMQLTLGAFEKS
jgi:hypothetical protein